MSDPRPTEFADCVAKIFSTPRLYAPTTAQVEALKTRAPHQTRMTLEAADAILRHEFNLLGSGPFVPQDPERSSPDGRYVPIDWYLDPVANLRFPRGIPHREWDLQAMRPGNADIKLPWELARCQHWATLGQAFRLTGDARYASEIADEATDFMRANPVGIGINWTCTMDVALRALNWALAFQLVKHCDELDRSFWVQAYGHLFDHGMFIRNNLENNYEVTSNHFLSNVVGLLYLGVVFRDLPQGREWYAFGREALEHEMRVQVLDDGADYESSVPYHRLVTELFLGAARVADSCGEPLSPAYLERLRTMVGFLIGVLRPDGLMPQVGDADDGRLHIFSGYGTWKPQDPRHLLAPAGLLLGEPAWCSIAGIDGGWEAGWWGLDIPTDFGSAQPLPDGSRLYNQAGIAVVRNGGDYLLVSNGVVGTKGFGNHKHNDQLAFEFHSRRVPLLVDAGSYVYTPDPEARNLFRSTRYHNTVSVDGEEQNEMRPEWLFRLFETARAEHLDFQASSDYVEYRGRHTGYRRLAQGATHERRLRYLKRANALVLEDIFQGDGSHALAWHFHFAPGVEVEQVEPGCYRLDVGDAHYLLMSREALCGRVSQAWYSPSYGVRLSCEALDMAVNMDLSETGSWAFAVAPAGALDAASAWATLEQCTYRPVTA